MIKGDKIYLRSIESDDLPKLRDWRNDPKVRHWCREYSELNMENQKKWFDKINSDPSIRMFAICVLSSDQCVFEKDFIGVCGLTSIDPIAGDAEFSLYIAPEYQNHGYGRDSLKTLLKWGFSSANRQIIWGETFEGNPAIVLFLSLGFKIEGLLRRRYFKNGKYIDCYSLSITREEFESV